LALLADKLCGEVKVCAVEAPGSGDNRKANLQDIAILTGGQVASENVGIKLDEVTTGVLGTCKVQGDRGVQGRHHHPGWRGRPRGARRARRSAALHHLHHVVGLRARGAAGAAGEAQRRRHRHQGRRQNCLLFELLRARARRAAASGGGRAQRATTKRAASATPPPPELRPRTNG